MVLRNLLGLALGIALVGCSTLGMMDVNGKVMDQQGKPLANKEVRISSRSDGPKTVMTDADGGFKTSVKFPVQGEGGYGTSGNYTVFVKDVCEESWKVLIRRGEVKASRFNPRANRSFPDELNRITGTETADEEGKNWTSAVNIKSGKCLDDESEYKELLDKVPRKLATYRFGVPANVGGSYLGGLSGTKLESSLGFVGHSEHSQMGHSFISFSWQQMRFGEAVNVEPYFSEFYVAGGQSFIRDLSSRFFLVYDVGLSYHSIGFKHHWNKAEGEFGTERVLGFTQRLSLNGLPNIIGDGNWEARYWLVSLGIIHDWIPYGYIGSVALASHYLGMNVGLQVGL